MDKYYFNGAFNTDEIGREMYQLMRELYPICRSITGSGFRETLQQIQKHIPLTIQEVASGTQVFDWTVPMEWNIRDAYVMDSKGERIVDFRKSNLHVVGYSTPVRKKMKLNELKGHLFSLPAHPDWIPYRTSYYNETWGFCLTHRQMMALPDEEYEVCIDSSLKNGYLSYGEYFIPGQTEDEILISTHACHPSLCNDNLSGVALATWLAKWLTPRTPRYSYRFLFIPGTIGSITWLFLNESRVHRIKHGLVAACAGGPGGMTYKRSRQGKAEIDRAVSHLLKYSGKDYEITEFVPYGDDERQFCSPGFNLPVGCLMKTAHGSYPEYHTSADNLDFIKPSELADSFSVYLSVFDLLENNRRYMNTNPKCEPQLGKRGLYRPMDGKVHDGLNGLALLWVLNLSDGCHSLLDISERSNLSFEQIQSAADALLERHLLKEFQVKVEDKTV